MVAWAACGRSVRPLGAGAASGGRPGSQGGRGLRLGQRPEPQGEEKQAQEANPAGQWRGEPGRGILS